MPSFWTFPPPATGFVQAAAAYNTLDFNKSITNFLRESAKAPPASGFGSTRPVYIQDTIEVNWTSTTSNEQLEQWCLSCTEPYYGKEGWFACENFSNTTATILYRNDLGGYKVHNYTLTTLENEPNISAAICTLGWKADPYDLSLAYAFINSKHEDSSPYLFSNEAPTGFNDDPVPIRGASSTATSEPTISPTAFVRPDPSPIHHKYNGGVIAGAVIGAVAGAVFLLLLLLAFQRRKRAAAARHASKVRFGALEMDMPGQQQGHTHGALVASKPPTFPPRPFVRDRLSDVERSESRRSGFMESSPPAYDDVGEDAGERMGDTKRWSPL